MRLLVSIFISLFIVLSGVAPDCVSAFISGEKDNTFDASVLKIDEDAFLGRKIPDVSITDQHGNNSKLSDYAGKPMILSIIYYRCAQSCPILNEGLADALNDLNLKIGEDYNVITMSFDGTEKPEDAKKFADDLKVKMQGKLPENFDKWVFAVSSAKDMKALTEAVGYRYFYSDRDKIFVHPNVYLFVSPDMKISRYLFGIFPVTIDVRLGIIEAAKGNVGKVPLLSTVTLACYKYDASIGGFRVNLPLIFAMVGLALALLTAVIVFVFSRNLKKRKMAEFQH